MAQSSARYRFPVSLFRHGMLPALAVAVLSMSACKQATTDPNDPKFVVAEKGDWKVTRGELDKQVDATMKQMQRTPEEVGQKMPQLQTFVLHQMVLEKLLLDRAAALNFKDTDKEEAEQYKQVTGGASNEEVEKQLKQFGRSMDDLKKNIHERVLIGKVFEAEAGKDTEPTDQEINDIYEKNKDKFVTPERVRASRVLIHVADNATPADKAAKKKAIDKAHDRVTKGEDISKVATDVSEDQSSKAKGGDLGFFQRGMNEQEFDEVAFKTKTNSVSPVFETPLGFQFIKVTGIQPAGTVPLAEARGYISGKLKDMKAGKAEKEYADKLLAGSGVTYHFNMVEPSAQTPPMPGGPGAAPGGAPVPPSAPTQPPASAATPPMTATPPPAPATESSKK